MAIDAGTSIEDCVDRLNTYNNAKSVEAKALRKYETAAAGYKAARGAIAEWIRDEFNGATGKHKLRTGTQKWSKLLGNPIAGKCSGNSDGSGVTCGGSFPYTKGTSATRPTCNSKQNPEQVKGLCRHPLEASVCEQDDITRSNCENKDVQLCETKSWKKIPSIRASAADGGPARYIPSSAWALGPSVSSTSGKAFKWSSTPLQINLERIPELQTDSSTTPPAGTVEFWNGDRSPELPLNWVDPHEYTLLIDSTAEKMDILTVSGATTSENVQWTITAHGHTVIRGTIDTSSPGRTRFVLKTGNHGLPEFRVFPKDLKVNPQESFDQHGNLEVEAYYFVGTLDDLKEGVIFTPERLSDNLFRDANCKAGDNTDSCESLSSSGNSCHRGCTWYPSEGCARSFLDSECCQVEHERTFSVYENNFLSLESELETAEAVASAAKKELWTCRAAEATLDSQAQEGDSSAAPEFHYHIHAHE
jgi:hypothetical protein